MKRQMKKAVSLILICSLFMVAALTACGNNGDTGSGTASGSGAVQTETGGGSKDSNVTLTIEGGQTFQTNNPNVLNEENFKEFEKQTGIKIETTLDPDNQVVTVLQTKLATGEVPDLILYNKVSAETDLNVVRNFVPLDSEAWVSRLQNPDMLKAEDGKIYGMAMEQQLGGMGVVYNKDIFKELNLSIPKTYSEFVKVCEAIKAKNINPVYAPYNDTWTIQIFETSAFGDYISKHQPDFWNDVNANKIKFADMKPLQDIMQNHLDLYKNGYISKSLLSDNYKMTTDVLLNKKAAMMFGGDFVISDLEKKDPNAKFGLFPLPYSDEINENLVQGQLGAVFFVPNKGKNIEQAKKLLDFLAQKEQLDRAQKIKAYLPMFTDATPPAMSEWQQEIYDNYVKTNKVTLEMNTYMKVDVSELFKYYQDLFAGAKDPKQVLEAWDKKFSELMKAKGYEGF